MGNAPSNKYCPKHVAEQTSIPSNHEMELNQSTSIENQQEDPIITSDQVNSHENKSNEILPELVCNTSTPYGCLGRRFIATIRTPSPPSIVNDSLNLLGVKSELSPPSQVTYSSRNWILCRDFLVDRIIENYEKVDIITDYEHEKSYLSNHLDTYGWVERSYQSTGLLRGEIVAPSKFTIDLYIDRPDLRQSLYTKLGPFNISDSGDAVANALITALSVKSPDAPVDTKEEVVSEVTGVSPTLLMDASIISDIFSNQDSINDIIIHGSISKIVGDPAAYFKVSIKYL